MVMARSPDAKALDPRASTFSIAFARGAHVDQMDADNKQH